MDRFVHAERSVQADREGVLPEPLQRPPARAEDLFFAGAPPRPQPSTFFPCTSRSLEGEERLVMVGRRAMRDRDGHRPPV